jgi:2-C-methyl-D-erythritol 4-phosphate cytidylyltransferase
MAGERLWVVIPAAGAGQRMSSSLPKQYLRLRERTVLEWSLAPFLARADVSGIVVAIAGDDQHFVSLPSAKDRRVSTALGGNERSDSVLNGLMALTNAGAAHDDWVLVHDAARPCLHPDDVTKLISAVSEDAVGGLLATPMADTLKVGDGRRVVATPSRENVWRALTPQMFRVGMLRHALEARSGGTFTDESAAIEAQGQKPLLVIGRADNIKITLPADLPQAEAILAARAAQL